ncbi:SH3 domain-containing protein [Leptospira venezuelensis]|uniref:SH3 domain-containing protein n=1 Tax=Leptospira venezuelensis TaxID=1958811 RepID=UPI0012FF87E0|nr:SH3 domain-containing protein [Leptospira venezuelensis]
MSTRSGLKVRETPSLKGKEFETLAYQTEVRVIRFGAEEKISGKEYPWALIEYKGESAWVYSGYLKVDCTEFDESYATPERISESDVEGDWKPEKNSEYYISIYVGGTFSANFFGGCDGDGCISAGASGKWEIKDNKIYFFNPGSDSVYVYWINDRRLIASDSAHSFKENYNSETISGWERY